MSDFTRGRYPNRQSYRVGAGRWVSYIESKVYIASRMKADEQTFYDMRSKNAYYAI